MQSTTGNQLFDPISADVERRQADVAQEIVSAAKQRLSVPVTRLPNSTIESLLRSGRLSRTERTRLEDSLRRTYRDDPIYGDGYKLQRSVRGEPARMETGKLVDSITSQTIDGGEFVEVAVFSDLDYAAFLETPKFGRLVLTDLADSYEEPMIDAAVRGVEGD